MQSIKFELKSFPWVTSSQRCQTAVLGPPYFTERTRPDRTQTLIHARNGMAWNACSRPPEIALTASHTMFCTTELTIIYKKDSSTIS